jgi:hypothetical protein
MSDLTGGAVKQGLFELSFSVVLQTSLHKTVLGWISQYHFLLVPDQVH